MSSSIKHVAIIMDGNGRWAQLRNRPRVWGHIRGSYGVSAIVEKADDLGINALTLYAFSSENWGRPKSEIYVLFKLLKKFLLKEKAKILKNKVQFQIIGSLEGLPKDTQKLVNDLTEETKYFKGLKLSFAFGYGGRNEILHSVNQFIKSNPGEIMEEKDFEKNLYRPEIGDVDLLIRTGGDYRISNYLLWQIAYAELYFTPIMWPDFTAEQFEKVILGISNRERRFGGLGTEQSLDKVSKEAGQNLNQFKSNENLSRGTKNV